MSFIYIYVYICILTMSFQKTEIRYLPRHIYCLKFANISANLYCKLYICKLKLICLHNNLLPVDL